MPNSSPPSSPAATTSAHDEGTFPGAKGPETQRMDNAPAAPTDAKIEGMAEAKTEAMPEAKTDGEIVAAPAAAAPAPPPKKAGRGRAIALSALIIALSASAGFYANAHAKRYVLSDQAGADDIALTRIDGTHEEKLVRGAKIGNDTRVRTSRASRVRIEHPDGLVVLERATEVTLGSPLRLYRGVMIVELGGDRRIDAGWFKIARVGQGTNGVATNASMSDAARDANAAAKKPRVQITFGDDVASVEAIDGDVNIIAFGRETTLGAHREATLMREKERVDLASGRGMLTSDTFSLNAPTQENSGAIGELRAKKPGAPDEQGRALAIAKQDVRIQVSGPVARTEIEQVFSNDSGDELEGVYRFPLPAGAELENLSLEVDGKWVDGEFVDRDRARAIWRGVIQHATKDELKPREEIIWVPGPWRDPALLEWQRGGRFELRIFPIPKKGERKVRIAYTEMLPMQGGARRYTYPLPAKSDVTIGRMSFEARVAGAAEGGIASRGYDLATGNDGAMSTLKKSVDRFHPEGDLTIDVRSPASKSLATTWTSTDEGKRTFAMAIRPEIPVADASKPAHHVIVVDSGRGMFGTRYQKATEVAAQLVASMDRRDRFTVMACDLTCKSQDGGARVPNSNAARDVEQFLRAQTPDGATDLIGATERALSAPVPGGFERRVTVLSHGYGGLGVHGDKRLTHALGDGLRGESRVVTVGLGSDVDRRFLEDIARAGRGAYVGYDSAAPLRTIASRVLEAHEGALVSDVAIEWPDGIVDIAPRRADAVRAGGELILAGTLTREHVTGDVIVRGQSGGRPFEARIPVDLAADGASLKSGASFVPRLYASIRTRDLDRDSTDTSKREAVTLSQKFHVPSQHTSLLVLESEAMFRSFGVERTAKSGSVGDLGGDTGSEVGKRKEEAEAKGGLAAAKDDANADDKTSPSKSASNAARRPAGIAAGSGFGADLDAYASGPAAVPATPPPAPVASAAPAQGRAEKAPRAQVADEASSFEDRFEPDAPRNNVAKKRISRPRLPPVDPRDDGGRYVRKIWVRTANVSEAPRAEDATVIEKLRSAADAAPNEREKRAKLVRKLADLGRIDELDRELRAWEERDPFDLELLLLRAQSSLLRGEVDEALRRYSGVLGVPTTSSFDLPKLTQRVLAAFATRGSEHACALRVALAEARHDEAGADRAIGCGEGAFRGERIAGGEIRATVVADAGDIDVIIVDSEGRHYDSTLGLYDGALVNVADPGSPRIALEKAKNGTYEVLVRRRGYGPARGKLRVTALGTTRDMAYDLDGTNRSIASVARVQLLHVAQLVDFDGNRVWDQPRW